MRVTTMAAVPIAALLAVAAPVPAAELILDFASTIDVEASGAMQVTETITVRAEGEQIRRGIYRDFPTDYRDRFGNRVRVAFDLVRVTRDGRPEPHHEEWIDDGVRVYAGAENVQLEPGDYTYALTYRTNRQLGFFPDHDELYWNVTGNGWAFYIQRATACVRLPAGVPADAIGAEAYTGPIGAKGTEWEVTRAPGCSASFATTAALPPFHGLTIVVTWPKGHVHEPTPEERRSWFLADNRPLVVGGVGILGLLGYFLAAWWRVGRDPDAGTLVVRYAPPDGVAPAAMRFVRRMGYDDRCFATTLLSLAVGRHLDLAQADGVFGSAGDYTVTRRSGATAPPLPSERPVLDALFSGSQRSVELVQREHRRIRAALTAQQMALEKAHDTVSFRRNRVWFVPGLILSVLVVLATVMAVPARSGASAAATFMCVWLMGWSFAVFHLLRQATIGWRSVRGPLSFFAALVVTLFAVPFVVAEGFGIWMLAHAAGWVTVAIVATCLGIDLVFHHLLKAPTAGGRRLLDEIEGFRHFLETVEKDPLNFRHPEGRTPAVFERYLPYALALDVEQQWAEGFADVLAAAKRDGESWRPVWYSGNGFNPARVGLSASTLASSLSSAVSSSSSPPGSSSGSGGGGSSGGGGGGGGGGGW